jgi:uncharacterized flavoprotein (TIGR03862 family)
MAATKLAEHPHLSVHLFEKRAGLGRKLLIAGSSGLNISHDLGDDEFASQYEGFTQSDWKNVFKNFGTKDWIQFIEATLKLETFLGTSHRYFVREMKASGLLKRWTDDLREKKVIIHSDSEFVDFESLEQKTSLTLQNSQAEKTTLSFDHVIFALGGASWETETPPWAERFRQKQIKMIPFEASNVGYEVDWSKKFLSEAEGKPLKKVSLETKRGKKLGELVITEYGLEGTPIYFCGIPGRAYLDLKPDLSETEILKKLSQTKENFSPMRRVKHYLALSEASENLVFHHTTLEQKSDLPSLVRAIKHLPIILKQPRPLSESISSRGGVALNEFTAELELKRYPGIFCAGEMMDWDAPTGGFLIQASVSQGAWVAKSIVDKLK